MVHQGHPDMPKFITGPRPPPLPMSLGPPEESIDRALNLYRWFWPIASWFTLLMNVIIMFMVIGDMWNHGYNFVAHIASISVLTGSFVALALTYQWILADRTPVVQYAEREYPSEEYRPPGGQ